MATKLVKFTSQSGKVSYHRVADHDPYVEKKARDMKALLVKYPLPSMTEEDIIQMKKDLEEYDGDDAERIWE